tara:strand:- start:70 stop:699 length:630 start_codon:yes stop_codon:yes gene_type:complete
MSLLNKKILFVHINKSCGGVIVENFYKNGLNEITECHRTLKSMLKIVEKKNIDKNKLFIFTIVRNPWARMLSMYLWYRKGYYFYVPQFYSNDESIDNDFNKWIEYIYSDKFDRTKELYGGLNIYKYCFCNQLDWMKDNNKLIDNINMYKIEDLDLEHFFTNVLNLHNYDFKTPVHPTKHSHYRNYYNDTTRELVRKHYQEDIKYFKYKY